MNNFSIHIQLLDCVSYFEPAWSDGKRKEGWIIKRISCVAEQREWKIDIQTNINGDRESQ